MIIQCETHFWNTWSLSVGLPTKYYYPNLNDRVKYKTGVLTLQNTNNYTI